MKKILSILPGLFVLFLSAAVLGQTNPITNIITTTPPIRPSSNVDPVCMQNAIEKRDNAIITAFDKFSTTAKSALEIRKTELKNAWNLTNIQERRKAIREAWQKYRTTLRAARKEFRTVRINAWREYYKDRRGCSGTPLSDAYFNEGVDIEL